MRSAHTVEQVRAAEAALMAQLPEGALMQRAASGLAVAIADLLGTVYGARVLLLGSFPSERGSKLTALSQYSSNRRCQPTPRPEPSQLAP